MARRIGRFRVAALRERLDARVLRAISLAVLTALLGCTGDESPAAPVVPAGPHETRDAAIPEAWTGTAPYSMIGTTSDARGGMRAAYLSSTAQGAGTPPQLTQSIKADAFVGHRIRLSAWIKADRDSLAKQAWIWMRVDDAMSALAYGNSENDATPNPTEWHQVSVVLDVPSNALAISFGAVLNSVGTLKIDDVGLERVGPDVPQTNLFATPVPLPVDSAVNRLDYSRYSTTAENLDFEGTAAFADQTTQWLASHSATLATTDPYTSLDDMSAIGPMIGAAHLVGLGEGTHGTAEFYRMKHRILRYLVEEQGFTYLAMEASAPEADDLNRYVVNGAGDPVKLLSHLGAWQWNTQEVLNAIRWLRAWNSNTDPSRRVRFVGFDMQFPGNSIDSVIAFVQRNDPSIYRSVATRFSCLAKYRNVGTSPMPPFSQYAALPAATRATCAADLQTNYDSLNSRRARYDNIASYDEVERLLYAARLVQQFESMASASTLPNGTDAKRDKYMAENIDWIRSHLPQGARGVLWAHNLHIRAMTGAMGGYLRQAYGSDYLTLGMLFGTGAFNAAFSTQPVRAWTASTIVNNSLEAAFVRTGKTIALFDARTITSGGVAAAPLGDAVSMRVIGLGYNANNELQYFMPASVPHDFDLLLYVTTSHPSTLLPFIF